MPPRKRNIVTGAVVLSALGMLVWMILTFSGGAMRIFKARGTPVGFLCDRADGLSDGSPVFFKGVQVGKVTRVTRMPDNVNVSIEGELENHPPLPQNLIGQIRAQSQLGTSSEIDLTTDGPAAGTLVANEQIKLRFLGQSIFPPEFSDMVAQMNKQDLVKHLDEVLVSIRIQAEKVGNLVGDPKLHDDLNKAMTNIRAVSERANVIAAKLDKLTANADTAVTGVRADMDRLTVKFGDDLDKLGITFRQFQEISAKINNGKGSAGQLINDPKLYDELTLTARQLNKVAATLSRLVEQWEREGVSIKTK
jgi:phospholipid/cholesterol/gamma-HCH transport system substrate-binding protein